MTSHELAEKLLQFPDAPVLAWDADSEQLEEVSCFTSEQGRVVLYTDEL